MRSVATLRSVFFGMAALTALILGGCAGGSSGGGGAPDPTIRFYNASTDVGLVNFLLDDDVKGAQLGYLSATGFVEVEAKEYDLRLQKDGTSIDQWSEVVTLNKDRHYLATAIGLDNFGSENLKRLRFVFHEIDRQAPNGSRSRIIILHAYNRAAGFETPNVDFQTPGLNPQFRAADIAYGGLRFLEVDAGNQTYEVRRAGTENILFQQNITLGGGKLYIAYLVGIENGAGATAPKIEFVEIPTETP